MGQIYLSVREMQMKSIQTCLMFVGEQAGRAEEAITLYTSLFDDSEIVSIVRHEGSGHDKDGTVQSASFTLNRREFIAMDSALDHRFTFTPSMSLSVECESSHELETAYDAFTDGGIERMPLDNYGFSQKFGWVDDRYGVSWQLSLA